jgi:two-component system chemotaxis sensor kinase CheA
MPEERAKAGKPRRGIVHLSALHSGAYVLISIKDDGKGLDSEAIFRKAVEKGLLSSDVQLSDKELFTYIMHPGFSTSDKIINVSGRGVGMDVVKQCIDSLRGIVEINSVRGEGTNITLKLPLTLAIIEGLLIKVGEGFYVIPLSVVEECIELTTQEIAKTHGRHLAKVRGELIPYVMLRDIFDVSGEFPEIQQIVVTRLDGHRVGFVVDHVIGEHQTVIKTLGKVYRDIKGISGATILGDGNVALIVDVPQLMDEALKEEDACLANQ